MSESDLSISERLVVLIVLIDLRRALEGQRQIGSGRETANGPRSPPQQQGVSLLTVSIILLTVRDGPARSWRHRYKSI
jgi:hypothetical protein